MIFKALPLQPRFYFKNDPKIILIIFVTATDKIFWIEKFLLSWILFFFEGNIIAYSVSNITNLLITDKKYNKM